jgi:glycosyltransferase-like protein
MSRRLRVAILTHSTNPRGGVVHGMELADALCDLGHEATLFAPGPGPLFRESRRCRCVTTPVSSAAGGLTERVGRRIDDYVAYFRAPAARCFDVYHAQDGLSGSALARLAAAGLIPGYVRTVHHLDDFGDRRLAQWDLDSILSASRTLCVSALWRNALEQRHGVRAAQIANGVDLRRFTPRSDGRDAVLRRSLGLSDGPIVLAVGGIEARKNTVAALKAFARVVAAFPEARFVIAGGASLLDHGSYRAAFQETLNAMGGSVAERVIMAGIIPDADMPALYRTASALAFPSVKEGFGLAVLEAMACGTPVIVSRIAPFTEYLNTGDCLWVEPSDPESIAGAMSGVLVETERERLAAAGLAVAARFPWRACAQGCLDAYASVVRSSNHENSYA